MRLPPFLHKFDLNRKTGMDRRTQMEHDVLLQMTDICKEFPGVKALDHVSLTVRRGKWCGYGTSGVEPGIETQCYG